MDSMLFYLMILILCKAVEVLIEIKRKILNKPKADRWFMLVVWLVGMVVSTYVLATLMYEYGPKLYHLIRK